MSQNAFAKGVALLVLISTAACDGGRQAPPSAPPAAGTPAAAGSTQDAAASRPEPSPPGTATWKDKGKKAIDDGLRFLRNRQTADYKWRFSDKDGVPPDLGITALCLLAMMESPRAYRESDGPFIREGTAWLAASQKPDGSIHDGKLATYNTSVSMLVLAATKNEAYRPVLDKALEFLRVVQSDESERYERGDMYYGGVGYGGSLRSDLSNTHFAVEAAAKAGMKTDDPFFKKAIVFLQRSQNASETNDLPVVDGVAVGNDGGAFYSPGATADEAKAGFVELPDGRRIRRSYGSMSYALLKSYLFCDLDRRDPRVRALLDWLSKNYTVEHNPGMEGADANAKYAGLYYYYLAMARGLDAAGGDALAGADGKPLPWKKDLAERLVALQQPDGAWVNDRSDKFWENSPVLATAYAVLALNKCLR
ncbi:MAG TPA: prenyltransferase/squalene oxidase repeat-containing protein [Planctomycetota bacterium]|nr:prenyltransferase/squalene oxidase repeat-containing protein [Planctomycetota bacterium]